MRATARSASRRGRSRLATVLLGAGSAAAAGLAASSAHAQLDINPPIPNVLLLIDTSGSMERMADGTHPEALVANKCTPGTPTVKNRWATLVEVLTGTIDNFSCYAEDRTTADFKDEFKLGAVDPYDYEYYLPFHRILSNGCTAGPGVAPTDWWDWPNGTIAYHDYTGALVPCTTPFKQANDGILDTFRDRVRFAMMTFDTTPDPGTGASGTSPDPVTGVAGLWSYYLNWHGMGQAAEGNPPNCAKKTFEVGARNPAAPPWEGRLIPFGPFNAPLSDVYVTNQHIQEALLALRPFGATPLAGMLTDAADFILNDTSDDPSTSTPIGPGGDPYFQGGCRKTFVVVLSDGEPNLDIRPACEETGTPDGLCPYLRPYEIAGALNTNPDPDLQVKTFAVGFGLSDAEKNGVPIDCKTLTSADFGVGQTCDGATGSLKACCELVHIAIEGGTTEAFFANDPASLKAELSAVLALITAESTSRTLPVFAGGSAAGGGSYQFSTSFHVPVGSGLWGGLLERTRMECNGATRKPPESLANKCDKFHDNVNSNDAARPRQFYTVLGDKEGTQTFSRRSIRPHLTQQDGLGDYEGSLEGPLNGPAFSATVGGRPEALEIDAPLPAECTERLKSSAAGECAEKLMRWEVGETNAGIPETRDKLACPPTDEECSELGAIYHATPVVVGTPKEYLRDESYSLYAEAQSKRPIVLYTATTDGQLHAFKVATNDGLPGGSDPFDVLDTCGNNELWSFIPPHVLPRMLSVYDQQALLLDGAPVVKDVIFKRSGAAAIAANADWRTILVAGGGLGGSFYYALDVTNPYDPEFLWQISTDEDGEPLFGDVTPTPGIATIAVNDAAGDTEEVAVAILAGGSAPEQAGSCARQQAAWPDIKPGNPTLAARGSVRCWGPPAAATPGPARSLTIVRLDTGEVLMNFRGHKDDGPPFAGHPDRTLVVPFDSPLTGVPVAFPSQAGQIANRVYVGDADGTLWRVDLSSPDPTKWTVAMTWDAYSVAGDTFSDGERIDTPPVVSIDATGNVVVLFSTGDQQEFTASGAKTRLWSILETPSAAGDRFITKENWVEQFTGGERVTGPISLFNSVAYFATYVPTAGGTASCDEGTGVIWGVDYIEAEAGTSPPTPEGRLAPDKNDIDGPFETKKWTLDPGVLVFGVAVMQTPTCTDTTTIEDPYLGGMRSAVSSVNSGNFQLVFQTGASGGDPAGPTTTQTQTVALPQPRQSTRIDSWAAILE